MDCKVCRHRVARLRCLMCEQAEEIEREKHNPRIFSEVIDPDKQIPFRNIPEKKRAVLVLFRFRFPVATIAKLYHIDRSTVLRYLQEVTEKTD